MIVLLGLRLTLHSGREAAVRLALIAAAVATGVTVLLSTLSLFNAFQSAADRPCWECTTGAAPNGWAMGSSTDVELWNYRQDTHDGQPIKRLDVAALGDHAPAPPGLARVPAPGQYYVSPAMAALLDATPNDQLADRFPGARAGLVGQAALSGPDDLVIVIGHTPAEVAAMAGTAEVDTIATRTAIDDTTDLYKNGFAIAGIGLLFPLLVLIGMATKLAAARREARLAAIRLAGATPRQITVISSVDAAAGALLGTLAGVGIFQLVRPAVAQVAITGSRFFPETVAPAAWQYAAVMVGVPLAAACAAVLSLRRVRISPLGAARKETPRPPKAWRVLPLPAGLGMFAGPVFAGEGREPNPVLFYLGLVLIMAGLVVSGPWLTMLAARLAARTARGPATLLASQRLAADPKGAFRAVTGLVLAVFLGTAIAGVVPAVISGQQDAGGGTLATVMRAPFNLPCGEMCGTRNGRALSPAVSAELLSRLRAYPGVAVLPVYAKPGVDLSEPPPCENGPPCHGPPTNVHVIDCQALADFPAIGRCAPGTRAVSGSLLNLLTRDNMLTIGRQLPYIGGGDPAVSAKIDELSLAAVLINVPGAAVRERVRTLLTTYTALSGGADSPLTFAEVAQARAVLMDQAQRVALAMVALTLLVAGCGLLVTVGGGLVERRQSFTLLRLCGTPTRTLSRVVVLESALPLVLAALLAAVAGLAVADPFIDQLEIKNASAALPGPFYFLSVGGGLLVSLLVVMAALPLLKRMTTPDNARFE